MSASAGSNGGSGGAARRRAWRTAWASARTASSGVSKHGTAPASSAAGASAPSQTASTGRSAPVRRRGDAAGDPGRAHAQRSHEHRHDRVDGVVREQAAQRALVLLRGRRRGQVDRVRDAQPRRRAGVLARDPGAAGVGEHRDAVAARERLAREQPRDVEHLPHRRGPQHAGVLEQRIDRHVRRRQALDRHDRLGGRDPPRDPPEAARVAERLQREQQHRRVGVLLPVLEEVVAGEVRLVAHRHERREPDAARRRRVDRRDPEPAALRGEADAAGRGRGGSDRRVEPDPGIRHAEAVGAHHPHARVAADGEQLVRLRDGRQHDERARRPSPRTRPRPRRPRRPARRSPRARRRRRRRRARPVGEDVQRPREAAGAQVANDLAAEGPAPRTRRSPRPRPGAGRARRPRRRRCAGAPRSAPARRATARSGTRARSPPRTGARRRGSRSRGTPRASCGSPTARWR